MFFLIVLFHLLKSVTFKNGDSAIIYGQYKTEGKGDGGEDVEEVGGSHRPCFVLDRGQKQKQKH